MKQAEETKILLLNPPGSKPYLRDLYCNSISKGRYYYQPTDLFCLSGILSKARHRLTAVDATVEGLSTADCLSRIVSYSPYAIVFISSSSSWKEDFEFLKKVKDALPDVILIGSGSIFLAKGRDVLEKNTFIDAALTSFITDDILTYLQRKEDVEIPNVIFRGIDGSIVGRGTGMPQKRFSIGIPRHDLFPVKKYRSFQTLRIPFTSILTSMGCPFPCVFCNYSEVPFALRDIDNVMEELEFIESLGIKEVYIRDYTFGINREYTRELCKRLIEKEFDITWFCLSRVDVLDEETIIMMKKAKCHTIQFGVESGDNDVLRKNRKGFTVEQVREAFKYSHKHGIKTVGYFMFGLPGEDWDAALKTIKLAKEIDCDYAAFSVTTPYEGTPLRDEALSRGWIDSGVDVLEGAVSFPVMETDKLTREQIWALRNKAIKEFYFRPHYVIKSILNIRSKDHLLALFREGASVIKSLLNKRD